MRQNIELIIKNNNESIDMSNYCNRLNRAKFAFNPRANNERRQSQITHVAAHRCVHRWPTGRWLTLLTERSIASNTREVSVKRGSLD